MLHTIFCLISTQGTKANIEQVYVEHVCVCQVLAGHKHINNDNS